MPKTLNFFSKLSTSPLNSAKEPKWTKPSKLLKDKSTSLKPRWACSNNNKKFCHQVGLKICLSFFKKSITLAAKASPKVTSSLCGKWTNKNVAPIFWNFFANTNFDQTSKDHSNVSFINPWTSNKLSSS
jgi:hypothetical protein